MNGTKNDLISNDRDRLCYTQEQWDPLYSIKVY